MKKNSMKRTAAIWLLTAFYRAQVLLVPSRKLEKSWGQRDTESPEDAEPWHYRYACVVADEVTGISDRTPWESKCLVRALTARYLLHRKGIKTTLYLGVGKDENGKMIAHSWLRCGKMYVTGGNGEGFGVVAKFCR